MGTRGTIKKLVLTYVTKYGLLYVSSAKMVYMRASVAPQNSVTAMYVPTYAGEEVASSPQKHRHDEQQ